MTDTPTPDDLLKRLEVGQVYGWATSDSGRLEEANLYRQAREQILASDALTQEKDAEIERLQARLDKALHCISKHQGGCINGCWEALSDDGSGVA